MLILSLCNLKKNPIAIFIHKKTTKKTEENFETEKNTIDLYTLLFSIFSLKKKREKKEL
jgi:hypothetical protein